MIRKATQDDLGEILAVYEKARNFMRKNKTRLSGEQLTHPKPCWRRIALSIYGLTHTVIMLSCSTRRKRTALKNAESSAAGRLASVGL